MHLKTTTIYIFVLISIVNAGVIPFRRIKIIDEVRSAKYISIAKRQTTMTLVAAPKTTIATALTSVTSISATEEPTSTSSSIADTTVFKTVAISEPTASAATTTLGLSSSPLPSSTPAPTLTPTSDPQPSQTIDASGVKYVVAHHMVGNTFPYTVQDWADDISLAHASGIDGFALNMGSDVWEPARVSDAYQAAQQSNLDFKLFLSLDMSSLPCTSADDAQNLRNLVNTYASHPNQLQYESRAFVSTFSGETCQFGLGSVPDGWKNQFTQHPDLKDKIYFVPAFFIDPTTFKDFADVMDGDFNWNSGWPVQITTSFAQNALSQFDSSGNNAPKSLIATADSSNLESNIAASVSSILSKTQLALSKFIGSTDTDVEHLSGLEALSGTIQARDGEAEKRIYMGAVSPWFFTHYGPDSFNKNFVYLADQHLYSKRWEAMISNRSQFDIAEILTWNDYGESHYIGPIKGDQPNSQAWTNGMNHTAWLGLTKYYATAFKTGQYPTIEKDQLFMWSRPHSTQAQAPDPIPQPSNFELLEDAVWAVVLTTAPATVTLTTSSTSSKTFQVPAGLSKLAVPITPGDTMKGVIQRDGKTVLELSPNDFTFQGSPQTYNFNAFVASATTD